MDFTGDGIADILSGCYWSNDESKPNGNPQAGYLMILKGLGQQDFEEAIPLTDIDGNPLLNVKLSKEQEENYDSSNIEFSNICTAQHAVDYDGDGDLDLVTGCMNTSFFVFTNSANDPRKTPTFDTPAEQLPIESPDRHSDPHLVDWDNDGDLDLLTGGHSGSVYLSINDGTREEPQWSDFTRLIRGSKRYYQKTDNGEEIKPAQASRVWVTDYNRDGRLDLLVGDSVTIHKRAAALSQAEANRLKLAHEKKMAPLEKKMGEIQDKYMDQIQKVSGKMKSEELQQAKRKMQQLSEKMQKEMEPFSGQYRQLYREREKFIDEKRTGHVWLYLQQESSDPAPAPERTVATIKVDSESESAESESKTDQDPERQL